jgi:pimeloyl-ACP methyl ester carboxylesterase
MDSVEPQMKFTLRSIVRVIAVSFFGLIGLLIIVIGAGLGYRAWRQQQTAEQIAIVMPNGIDERLFVRIGGIEQWTTIRGNDRDAPAILFVHGGPGVPNSPLNAVFAQWEKKFVVVQWDQRGAGRTYSRSGPLADDVTIDRMAQDGIEVADYIRRHLHKDKIIVFGVSWGSDLGVRMVKARSDLFLAYVGTAQIVGRGGTAVGYRQLLARARAKNDTETIKILEASPPPYRDDDKFSEFETLALTYESHGRNPFVDLLPGLLFSPDYNLKDIWAVIGPPRRSSNVHFFGAKMDGPFATEDLYLLGTDFATPIFIFQGAEDDLTPALIARSWFDAIKAPKKAFELIPGEGHGALISQPQIFIKLMEEHVLPLARTQ